MYAKVYFSLPSLKVGSNVISMRVTKYNMYLYTIQKRTLHAVLETRTKDLRFSRTVSDFLERRKTRRRDKRPYLKYGFSQRDKNSRYKIPSKNLSPSFEIHWEPLPIS